MRPHTELGSFNFSLILNMKTPRVCPYSRNTHKDSLKLYILCRLLGPKIIILAIGKYYLDRDHLGDLSAIGETVLMRVHIKFSCEFVYYFILFELASNQKWKLVMNK